MNDLLNIKNNFPLNDEEYRIFLDWLMCADPFPGTDAENAVMVELASVLALQRGYADWIEAYHRHDKTNK